MIKHYCDFCTKEMPENIYKTRFVLPTTFEHGGTLNVDVSSTKSVEICSECTDLLAASVDKIYKEHKTGIHKVEIKSNSSGGGGSKSSSKSSGYVYKGQYTTGGKWGG